MSEPLSQDEYNSNDENFLMEQEDEGGELLVAEDDEDILVDENEKMEMETDDNRVRHPKRRADEAFVSAILPGSLNDRIQKRVKRHTASVSTKIDEYLANSEDEGEGKEVAEVYAQLTDSLPEVGEFTIGAPAKKKKDIPKAGVQRGLNKPTKKMQIGKIKQAGKWNQKGVASGRGPKAGTRDLQLLNQLSQAMIDYVKDSQEVEAMAVNDRIVVSANEQATIVKIGQAKLEQILASESTPQFQSKREKLSSVAAAVTYEDGDELDEQHEEGIDRLTRLEVDSHYRSDQASGVKSFLAALSETLNKQLQVISGGSPKAVAKFIDNDAYIGRIITIDANTKMVKVKEKEKEVSCTHAEQNLVYALVLSGYTGTASIAGGKRPCTVCWLSLRLARDAGFDIRFNMHAGGYWNTTTLEGLQLIAEALGYDEESLKTKVTELMPPDFKQYATDPSVEGPREVNLREDVSEKRLVTDMGTPSQSLDEYPYSPGSPVELPPLSTFTLAYQATEDVADPDTTQVVLMDDGTKISIGRKAGELVLPNPKVSRDHGSVWFEGDAVQLSVAHMNTLVSPPAGGKLAPAQVGQVYSLTAGGRFKIGPYFWKVVPTT